MKKKILYIILPALLTVSACRKQLNTLPQSSLDAATAFNTRQGIATGLTGVYDGIQQTGYMSLNFLLFADMYGDNIQEVGTFPTFAQVYNKILTSDNVDVQTIWNAIYSTINRANTILAAANQLNDPLFAKASTIGQCEAIRAMCYFDLLRMFGGSGANLTATSTSQFNQPGGAGVPLKLTPTLTVADAAPIPRATEAAVYAQILLDINDAISKLPAVTATGQVNLYVAQALKSRIQLYYQNYTDAATSASAVISSGKYSLVSGANYGTIYTKGNSSESIWELQYNTADQNAVAFYYFTAAFGGRNEVSSTALLNAAFEPGDIRKPINFTVAAPGIPAAKTLKYTRPNPGIDPVMMFRLAEMYLTRAEAEANMGGAANLALALADLNVVRNRAGLPNSLAVTQAAIITAILNERRVELAHEGQRFFDLRRVNNTAILGITEPFRNLFPIPFFDFSTSNGVIAQNTGY
jgi:hypothetical protein